MTVSLYSLNVKPPCTMRGAERPGLHTDSIHLTGAAKGSSPQRSSSVCTYSRDFPC